MLRTAPLDACAFGARLGNRSVFILDPRLMSILPYAGLEKGIAFEQGVHNGDWSERSHSRGDARGRGVETKESNLVPRALFPGFGGGVERRALLCFTFLRLSQLADCLLVLSPLEMESLLAG